jgi:hypothetical protein
LLCYFDCVLAAAVIVIVLLATASQNVVSHYLRSLRLIILHKGVELVLVGRVLAVGDLLDAAHVHQLLRRDALLISALFLGFI